MYLIKTVETYRAGSEAEAKEAIEQAKKDKTYTLSKYASEYKCAKAKGEIVDEWWRVTLTKDFNVEKEPDTLVKISYSAEPGFFPEPVDSEEDDEDEAGGIEF